MYGAKLQNTLESAENKITSVFKIIPFLSLIIFPISFVWENPSNRNYTQWEWRVQREKFDLRPDRMGNRYSPVLIIFYFILFIISEDLVALNKLTLTTTFLKWLACIFIRALGTTGILSSYKKKWKNHSKTKGQNETLAYENIRILSYSKKSWISCLNKDWFHSCREHC